MRQSNRIRNSTGYTLLEAALAISISMVLLYAMFRATAMHYMSVTTGREIAEQTQIARGVMDRVRADLRATFTSWEPTLSQPATSTSTSTSSTGTSGSTGSTGGGSTSGSSSGSASGSSSSSTPVQSDYNPPAGGVLGTDSSLTIAVLNTTEGLDFATNSGQAGNAVAMSDVRMIRYSMADNRNAGPDGKSGLVRERIHRIPDPTLPSQSNFSTSEVLAEEVQSIQFRYYDGTDWLSTWDSLQIGPPKAIEAQIQMLLPSTAEGVNAGNWLGNSTPPSNSKSSNSSNSTESDANKSLVTFRVVVAMPPAISSAPSADTSASGSTGATTGGS